MLDRLKVAGAESRIWSTQYGFKSGSGTADALFMSRRLLDRIWASSDSSAIFLALDWAKAFDSISPVGLADALVRFGIPPEFVDMVSNIYSGRKFHVKECGKISNDHCQAFGISQGCPLSPFLFTIVMTVLISDAHGCLAQRYGDILSKEFFIHELLYADDTLLVDCAGPSLQKYMMVIEELGREYGLELNWKKIECLPIRCQAHLSAADGSEIPEDSSITYLGALLANDGKIDSELSRRIGMAAADFKMLKKIWNHVDLSIYQKYRIFDACIISKLLYGLHTAWLSQIQRRKLDGFYIRCLRQILGIRPSFISRVSNEAVLARLGVQKLSLLLLEQQLRYFGKIARLPDDNPLRQITFQPSSLMIAIQHGSRRRGRPRTTWIEEVNKHAILAAGSRDHLYQYILDTTCWTQCIRQYCRYSYSG